MSDDDSTPENPAHVAALIRIAHMAVEDGGEATWKAVAHTQSRMAREALGLLPPDGRTQEGDG